MPDQVGRDGYWKKKNYNRVPFQTLNELISHTMFRFDRKHGSSRTRMIKNLKRNDRGLLCYHSLSDAEVAKFVTERRVMLPSNANETRESMIRMLQLADEEQSFDRILDLPSEMRCLIYRHHFSEFPDWLLKPAHPPLTKVSRLIRSEALPIFFETCSFTILLHQKKFHVHRPAEWRFNPDSYTFLLSQTPQSLAEIRRFELVFSTARLVCKITIGNPTEVKCEFICKDKPMELTRTRVGERLQEVFEAIAGRGRDNKLKIEDLFAARRVFEQHAGWVRL